MAECVIKFELLVLNEFSYAVDLKPVFVDDHQWITERHTVNLAVLELSREDRSLLDAHRDFKLVSWNVLHIGIRSDTWMNLLVSARAV